MSRAARSVAVISILLLIGVEPVLGQPPIPSSFYGRVGLDGTDVNPGAAISAWIGGVKIAETAALMYAGHSVYAINVPGDDPESPAIEGGVEGDAITFRVLGHPSQDSAEWHSATNVEHDIAALSAPTNRLCLPLVFKR
jgi:hypothetical protein